MIMVLCASHSWMSLAESSNMEVSGASEVPQSRDKLFFSKSSCCVLLENQSRSTKIMSIEIDRNAKVQAITSMNK